MSFKTQIIGTGHYVPTKTMTNEDIAKLVDTNNQWILERTGISERRIADPEKEYPSEMAIVAARQAIESAKMSPNDIDLILFSITIPDMFFPNTASILQQKLGITNNCPCLDISAACTGYLYGLGIADSFIKQGHYKNILLIGCEMTSQFNNWEDRSTCILFGDGCGATILGRSEDNSSSDFHQWKLASDSSKKDALMLPKGAAKHPITHEILEKREQYVSMDGQQVFKAAVKTMSALCAQVLEQSQLNLDQVDWFIPHQANLRIIEAVGKRLGFPGEKTITNVQKYANTSSASIPIALNEAIRSGTIKRGDRLLFSAFGAGLTSGAIALTY
jgi:3-oxoacyl-[acyl-carrier-protein] synthase-3